MYGILDVMVNLLTSLLNLNRNMKGGERGSRIALYVYIFTTLTAVHGANFWSKLFFHLCHKSSCQMQSKGQGYYQRFWGTEYCLHIRLSGLDLIFVINWTHSQNIHHYNSYHNIYVINSICQVGIVLETASCF